MTNPSTKISDRQQAITTQRAREIVTRALAQALSGAVTLEECELVAKAEQVVQNAQQQKRELVWRLVDECLANRR